MRSVQRAYHKGWQSDRPLKRHSRRVKWFEGGGSIRLMFEDGLGRSNRFYTDKAKATADYEAFIAGEFGALDAPLETKEETA